MGMTIDEAYGILSNGLVNAPSEHEWCVAFKMAIDTMRKYQKIEQIIHDDWIKGVNSGATLNKIEEVLEDGRD